MTTDNGSELVRKVEDIIVEMPDPQVPWEDVARAVIKTTLEELQRHFATNWSVTRAVDAQVTIDAFARQAGIHLEPESDGGQQDG